MALTYQFLIDRANEAAKEADEATLDNVRRKALRSEAAWRDMAERALKMDEERERARIRQVREDGNAGGDGSSAAPGSARSPLGESGD